MQLVNHLKKLCWGRHPWARGFFAASSGNVTDETIMKYIRTQEMTKADDDLKVEDAGGGHSRSGFQPTYQPIGFQLVVVQ